MIQPLRDTRIAGLPVHGRGLLYPSALLYSLQINCVPNIDPVPILGWGMTRIATHLEKKSAIHIDGRRLKQLATFVEFPGFVSRTHNKAYMHGLFTGSRWKPGAILIAAAFFFFQIHANFLWAEGSSLSLDLGEKLQLLFGSLVEIIDLLVRKAIVSQLFRMTSKGPINSALVLA